MIIRFPEDEGKVFDRFTYPAGEQQVRIREDKVWTITDGVQLVANIYNSHDAISLMLLVDAISQHTNQLHLILPYLPYSRADRRFASGDCFGLFAFAQMLDVAGGPASVTTLDAHSPVAETLFFDFNNVSPAPLIEDVRNMIGSPVILLPDKGAERYGLDALQCTKNRDPKTGILSGFTVPKKEEFHSNPNILIVDDICDGGGTFIGIAEALEKEFGGAENFNLYLYVTHGIFSKGFGDLNWHFDHIYTTNTFPAKGPDKLVTVLDAMPLLLEGLK